VRTVQRLINERLAQIVPLRELVVDGDCGQFTIGAIEEFQRRVVGTPLPDGRVDPGGRTLRLLEGASASTAIDWNRPQPGPRAVWNAVQVRFPVTRFLGIYARRNVRGRNTPSAHAEGRALDIGLLVSRPTERDLGDRLFRIFIARAAELGLHHVIWNRQIWSTTRGGPRAYTGVNAHTDHLHVAWTQPGSQITTFPRFLTDLASLRTGTQELGR
jgi:hypothetical protein